MSYLQPSITTLVVTIITDRISKKLTFQIQKQISSPTFFHTHKKHKRPNMILTNWRRHTKVPSFHVTIDNIIHV